MSDLYKHGRLEDLAHAPEDMIRRRIDELTPEPGIVQLGPPSTMCISNKATHGSAKKVSTSAPLVT